MNFIWNRNTINLCITISTILLMTLTSVCVCVPFSLFDLAFSAVHLLSFLKRYTDMWSVQCREEHTGSLCVFFLLSWQRRSGTSSIQVVPTSTDHPAWPRRWSDSTLSYRRRSASRSSARFENLLLNKSVNKVLSLSHAFWISCPGPPGDGTVPWSRSFLWEGRTVGSEFGHVPSGESRPVRGAGGHYSLGTVPSAATSSHTARHGARGITVYFPFVLMAPVCTSVCWHICGCQDNAGNRKKGFKYLLQAAEAGDRSSMIIVARAFDTGISLPAERSVKLNLRQVEVKQ